MEGRLEGRITNVLESLTIGLIFCGLYWLIGLIIKNIFKIEIRKKTGYTICLLAGLLLPRILITYLST